MLSIKCLCCIDKIQCAAKIGLYFVTQDTGNKHYTNKTIENKLYFCVVIHRNNK